MSDPLADLRELELESKNWTEVQFSTDKVFEVCNFLDHNEVKLLDQYFVQMGYIRFKDPRDATTFKLMMKL